MTAPRTAVRRLALARAISVTGSAAAYTALTFEIYDRTGSSVWLAAALLVTEGVSGLLGPFASMLGDRFDRRTVMIVSDLAAAACFAGRAWSPRPPARWSSSRSCRPWPRPRSGPPRVPRSRTWFRRTR